MKLNYKSFVGWLLKDFPEVVSSTKHLDELFTLSEFKYLVSKHKPKKYWTNRFLIEIVLDTEELIQFKATQLISSESSRIWKSPKISTKHFKK